MKNRKRIYTSISIFLLFTILFACQNTNQGGRNFQPQSLEQTNYSQEGDNDYLDDQPQLVGGSERDVREPHPVSNNKLQKEYPNIVVLHGSPMKNQVALTFDDGPDTRFTPQVLDVLAKHDVKATFFLIGSRAKAHKEITKRIHDEGHAIGNHTYWHPNLPKEHLGRLHWELTETEQVIMGITGFKPRLFRSPYGALNDEMVKMLGEKNNTVIGWNVDSLDWKQQGADIISDNVLSNVGFGSIILMHDGGDWSMDLSGTAQSLNKIISKLKKDGAKFVTVPELIGVPEAK
ncbi:peptidoglycan-N-acetylglucosamine deacetylase [Cytobacillus horneckiae]|nr:polysaccharide deacetylase family protein [Cytobacillus horneckiae]